MTDCNNITPSLSRFTKGSVATSYTALSLVTYSLLWIYSELLGDAVILEMNSKELWLFILSDLANIKNSGITF